MLTRRAKAYSRSGSVV